MKTKSHGTAFAYPVAPLMWKSGTRHVLMARAGYVARPIAMSSTVTLSHLSIQGAAISGKPNDVEVAPDTIAAGFKVMVDSGLLDQGTGGPTGALPRNGSRCFDEDLVARRLAYSNLCQPARRDRP